MTCVQAPIMSLTAKLRSSSRIWSCNCKCRTSLTKSSSDALKGSATLLTWQMIAGGRQWPRLTSTSKSLKSQATSSITTSSTRPSLTPGATRQERCYTLHSCIASTRSGQCRRGLCGESSIRSLKTSFLTSRQTSSLTIWRSVQLTCLSSTARAGWR